MSVALIPVAADDPQRGRTHFLFFSRRGLEIGVKAIIFGHNIARPTRLSLSPSTLSVVDIQKMSKTRKWVWCQAHDDVLVALSLKNWGFQHCYGESIGYISQLWQTVSLTE